MRFLRAPTTKYASLSDVGKFEMIWNVNVLLVPIFFLLGTLMYYFDDPSYKTAFFSFAFSLTNVIVLKSLKKYELVSHICVILASLIIQVLIFVVDPTRIVPAVLWAILVSFFAFYLLRAWIGVMVLVFNMIGVLAFTSFGDYYFILENGIDSREINFGLLADISFVTIAFIFMLRSFNKTISETHQRFEKQSLKNEILLKEIHHRVKNNLQIISSLLKLQASESESDEVAKQFDEAIGRIQSIALVHQKMYTNEDLSEIDLPSYIEVLVKEILRAFNRKKDVKIEIVSDLKKVDINYFVHFSLILNELITNSLKHGFKDKTDGKLKIILTKENNNLIVLYQDNGTWVEPTNSQTFGLNLLEILTEQLDGTFKRTIEYGTSYRFIFPIDKFLIKDSNDIK